MHRRSITTNVMNRSRGAVRPFGFKPLLRAHNFCQNCLTTNETKTAAAFMPPPYAATARTLPIPPPTPAQNQLLRLLSVSFALPKPVSAATAVTAPLSPMPPAFCELPHPPPSAPQLPLLPTLPGRTGGSWEGRMGVACSARRSNTAVEATRWRSAAAGAVKSMVGGRPAGAAWVHRALQQGGQGKVR